MVDLKPCPVCGGDSRRVDIPAEEDREEFAGGSYIECARCGLSTNLHFDRKENLLPNWNHRPLEDALAAENARLREHVALLRDELSDAADGYNAGDLRGDRARAVLDMTKQDPSHDD